jgi:hypothetical protein
MPSGCLSSGTSSTQSLTPASVSFGTSAVDTTNDTITVGSGNPFTTGEAVVYHKGTSSDTSIGGLADGQTYYAIVNSSQPTKVQLASTQADATAGHAIDLTSAGTSSSQTLTPASVVFTPTDVTSSPLVIDVGANNPFVAGEAVVYHKGTSSDTSIGGLTDGTTYYVVTNPAHLNQIGLAGSQSDALAGNATTLTSGGTGISQYLTPVSVTFGTSAVDTTNNTITVGSSNPFMLGQAVVYHNGGGTSIGGLVDGQTYYVIPDSSDATKIQLAATPGGNVIALTSTGSGSSQSLAPAGGASAVSFGPSNVIQSTLPDTIDLGYSHGFVTGQPVFYYNGGGTGIGIQNRDGSSGTLNNGGVVYYVIVVNDHTIKLAASRDDATAGRAINLTANGSSPTQSIQAVNTGISGPTFGPAEVVTSDQANSINTALPHGLTNGQAVVYNNGGSTGIDGLTNGHLYYAVVDPSNPNQLQLAPSSGGSALTLTSHGTSTSQSVQGATLGTPTSPFGPSSVIPASAANVITFGNPSGFNMGDALVYDDGSGTDIGGLSNGQTYYAIVDPNNPNQLRLAATAADATAKNAIPLTSTGSATTQAFHPLTLGTTSATFDSSQVIYYSGDATDNSINLGPTNPFHTGDALIYNDGGGTDLGGLSNGHVYYAIVNSAHPGLLQLADSAAHATAGTALPLFSPGSSSTQSFQKITVGTTGPTFGPTAVTPASIASSVDLGTTNPFHSGDALVYNDNGGTDVGGLEDGQVYYAIVDPANPNLVKVAASASDALLGNAVALTSGGNSAQTFTPVTLAPGASFSPSGVITGSDINTINTATPVGFAPGQAVTYNDGGGSDIGGLSNGQTYYAIVDTTQFTRLRLAATAADAQAGNAITLTSAGSSSTQQFTAVNTPPAGASSTAAKVDAGGDVAVRADSQESVVSISAAGAGSGGVAFGASIGSFTVNDTTKAYVGSGATVYADGNVRVSADDEDAINMLAGTITGAGAAAIGASVGIPIVIKNTDAYIGQNATVNALGQEGTVVANVGTYTESYAPQSFDPSSAVTVDTSDNEIDLGYDPGFTTGTEVVYNDGGGADIGGLVNGEVYFVILPDSSKPSKLNLAATAADATAGTAIALTSTGGHSQQSLRKVTPNTSHTFNAATKVTPRSAANTINVTNSFSTGDAVVYHAGGGTAIPTLVDGTTYYVIEKSTSAIQLAATSGDAVAGNAIALPSGGTSTAQSLTPTSGGPVVFGPSQVVPSSRADTIDLGYAHGYTTGQALVYNDGGGTDIGGLTNGHVYYAIVDASQPHLIQLAATPDDATAGNVLALTAGSGSQQHFDTVADAAQTFDPAATASATANTIDLGYAHGFTTGQAVDYNDGGSSALGGLTDGNTYYAIVNPNNPTKLRLAATKADALAGNALLLTSKGSGSTHSINPHGFSTPGITNKAVTEPGLFSRRLLTADTTKMKGVAVTASSTDDVEQLVIAGSGAVTAAIPVSASIQVLNNHTNAYIDSGAKVNTTDQADAGSGQSVLVAAGSDYYHLGVAGGAGGAAVGAGVDVAVVTLNTLAYINGGATVNALDDVSVLAHSKERVLSVALGAGFAGVAGVGGSVSVPVVNTTTLAFIGNQDQSSSTTVVHAGNNVQVAAGDETHALTVDGGFGVGGGGGAGVSVPVTVFIKDTESYIGNGSDVRGLAGSTAASDVIPVLEGTVPAIPQTFDGSSSTVVNTSDNSINLPYDPGFGTGAAVVYDNGGGGNIGGLTGGTVYYAIVDSSAPKKLKLAKTRQDALNGKAITLTGTGKGNDQTIKSAGDFRTKTAQGVAVQATSSEDVLTVAVAGGAGAYVGLAGTVAVTVIHADTRAFIDDAVINDPTGVTPGSAQAVSVGAADFSRIHTVTPSVAGGFVGVSGAVNVGVVNNDTRAYIGSDATVNAQGNVDVLALSNKDFDSTTISISGGVVGVGGAVAVFSLDAALDSNSQTALRNPSDSSSNAASSSSNLQQVSDATNALGGTQSSSNSSTQVSTGGSQQTTGNSGLVTANLSNIQSSVASSTTQSNTAGDSLSSTTPTSGTVAYIGGTSTSGETQVTAGGNVSVQAKETATASVLVGQGSAGLVGVGAAVGVLTIDSNTQAFLDSDAVVAATGNVTVGTAFNEQTLVKVYAAQGGLTLAIGSEVAANNDNSNQLAYVADNARVDQAGALNVSAQAKRSLEADGGGVNGGGVAIGVASVQANAGGSTVAAIGKAAQIGQTNGETVGSLAVSAANTTSTTVNGVIVASGGLSGGGDNISATVNPDVLAYVGQGAQVTVTGAADVGATSSPSINVDNKGGGNGGITISAVITSATIGGKTWAFIDQGANVTADAVAVTATTPNRNATATSEVLNISIGAANGSNTSAEVGGSVEAFVGRPPSYTFDATSAVDGTRHYITLGSTSLKTGDAVVYNNGGGTSIGLSGGGTLTSGATYYAIVDSNHPDRVQLASSLSNAKSGTALALLPVSGSSPVQSITPAALTTQTTLGLAGQPAKYTFDATSAVDSTGHFITLSGTHLKTGDAVVYDNGGGASIGLKKSDGGTGTLKSGGTYYAIVDPTLPNQVQLAPTPEDAQAGSALQLMPISGSSSTQSLNTGTILIHAESASNPVTGITLGAGGIVTYSAAISDAKADGTTSAFIGDNATIGTASQPVNSLIVTAQTTDVGSGTATLGSGGLGTGRGSDTEVHVTPTVTTFLGQNNSDNVAHDVQVVATSTSAEGHATANSYGGGGTDVGVPTSTVVTSPTVLSSIGVGSTLTVGGDLTAQALAHADKSTGPALTDFIQGVDTIKDTINFTDYGLQNGDPVLYQPASGSTPIQNSTAGDLQQYLKNPDGTFVTDAGGNKIARTYHVLQVVTTDSQGNLAVDPNNLRLGDDFNGGQIDSGNLFATGSGVDPTRNVIRFAAAHAFQTGDAVRYVPGSGSASISALNTTTTYFVRKIDDFTIKLYTSRADAIAAPATFTGAAIDPVKYTITLSGFQDGELVSYQAPAPVQFPTTVVNAKPELDSSGNLTGKVISDPNGNEIAVGVNDYQTGDALIYRTSDPSNPIGGLTDGATYYVIKNLSNPYVIQLAATADDTIVPNPIHLSTSDGAAAAKHYLVRPSIIGLTSGATYKLKLVSGNTYNFLDSSNNVVKIAAPGWTFSSQSGVSGNGSGFTGGNPNAPQGSQVAFLQGTGVATQALNFAAGTYTISFKAAQRQNVQNGGQVIRVLVDGAGVGDITPAGTSYAAYTTNAFPVTAGWHIITFQGLNPHGGDNTAFIDQLSVSPVFSDPGFGTPNVGTGFQSDPTGSPWTFTGTGGWRATAAPSTTPTRRRGRRWPSCKRPAASPSRSTSSLAPTRSASAPSSGPATARPSRCWWTAPASAPSRPPAAASQPSPPTPSR